MSRKQNTERLLKWLQEHEIKEDEVITKQYALGLNIPCYNSLKATIYASSKNEKGIALYVNGEIRKLFIDGQPRENIFKNKIEADC